MFNDMSDSKVQAATESDDSWNPVDRRSVTLEKSVSK